MNIALFHDAIVPPLKYGGTERIISWLARGLHSLGHRVTLISQPGSAVPGVELIEVKKESTDWESLVPANTDIVHLWNTPSKPPRKPFVITIQGNGKPNEVFHPNTIFISKSHARNHGAEHYVYNGIDPDEYPCDSTREDYLVFLAKASWSVKNLTGAIEIARAVGMRLEVMGSRDWPWGLQRYLPAWRGIHYHGMVDDKAKRAVLRKARALLFPVRWPEPFGIALTEALASGCAVFGTPYGSLPEIVTPEVGFLNSHASQLIDQIKNLRPTPETCRKRVYQGFTHLDMSRSYVTHYETVLRQGVLARTPPRSQFQNPPETLLPFQYL